MPLGFRFETLVNTHPFHIVDVFSLSVPLAAIEDTYDKTETFNGSVTENSIHRVLTPTAPSVIHTGYSDSVPSDTESIRTAIEGCLPTAAPVVYHKSSGQKIVKLSDLDTKDAAIGRVPEVEISSGKQDAAYREQPVEIASDATNRTSSASFAFSNVKATAVITCPGSYKFTFHHARRLRGATTPWEPVPNDALDYDKNQTLNKSGEQIEGEVHVPEDEYLYEYTISKITAINTAPCVAGTFGSGMEGMASIHSMINLGPVDSLRGAGILFLDEKTIDSSIIYSPAALKYSGNESAAVSIVRDSLGRLRQVKVPAGLADITTLESPAEGYNVAFYYSGQVGAADPVTGIYALTDSPFVTRRYDNPDAGQIVLAPRLRVAETRGQSVKVFTYVHNPETAMWSLSQGGGLLVTEEVTTTDGNGDEVKTRTLKTEAGAVSSVTSTTYHTFPWAKEKISEVLDPAGAALTTTWSYYDNETTDGLNYRRVKLRSDASGYWERYTYDADGRVATRVSPFLNSLPTAPDAQSRVTTTTRTALADADGDSIDEQLTTVIDFVLGQETGRSYEIEWSSPVTLGAATFERSSDIRCVAAGAAWNATGNLTSETLRYTTGDFSGRVRRNINSDGTASLTTYTLATNGNLTTVSESGVPNGTFDAIIDGSRTTTVTSALGQVVQSSTQDIVSTLTLEQWAATQFDAFGRPTRMDYTDGTYETRNYACCGLATSRGRQGRVTSYDYDALGRVEYVTRDGITNWTQYDADGRVKSVTRIGTDDSEIVQETNQYDLAGRLYERRDALSRLTSTAETFNATTGERTVTTTNPDLGTVIEITARDGSRLSVGGTAAAPMTYAYGYDSTSGQLYTLETRIGPAGATTEWTKTYTDFAGRTVRIAYPDGATVQSFYNTLGQLQRQVDPDNVTTLYAYNARGEQSVSAVDVDSNHVIDFGGLDRVVRTTTIFANKTVSSGTYVVQRTTTEAWETDNANTPTTVSVSEQTPDGLRSWSTTRGLTTSSVATYDGSGGHTVVTTAPDNKTVTQTYVADLLMSQTVTQPTLGTLSSASYTYDAHHRLETQTDLRNGTTTYTYYDDDQMHTVLSPDPDTTRSGPGYDAQLTTYGYDDAGRQNLVTLPDTGEVHTTYYPHGQVKRTWGTRTYPTEYTYDPQLRVKTLTTWKDFASNAGAAVTTWNYHPQRGWLDNKRYADNTGPSYAYKPSGRLETRTWARLASTSSLPLITTYSYTSSGDLNSIDYSDDTPDVSLTAFDRLGRPHTITDAAGTRSLTYSVFGQSEDETYTAGPLNGLTLDRTYDGYARLQTLSVPSVYTAGYDYDAASRLDTVTQGTRTAKYAYVPNSPLVESVTIKNNGTLRLTTTKGYDRLNRLGSIANTPSAATPAHTVGYDYNAANQRAKATREDATFWDYGYDSLGQVDSAVKKQAGGTAIPGHAYGFLFDDIGNRQTATFNGTTTTYTPNELNQYDQRTVPGVIEVLGDANPAATITYTIGTGLPQPVTRQGGLFHAQAAVDNSTAPVTTALTVTGVKNNVGTNGEDAVTAFTRTVFTPQTPEAYDYDTDGNLRTDALWSYEWDAENRLKSMETSASAVTAGRPRVKHDYAYDGQGRRFAKKTYAWDSGDWVLTTSRLFVYDGWNLLAELDWNPSTSTFILNSTYTWGLDLSGSLQGAGGVGGLLWLNAGTATHATGYDGNGNVIALVDLADGSTSATYDYGPFGDTLKADGPAAALNPYRFSTKFTDDTGLLYYGLRYYNPSTGRWINRDPIEEFGGFNLYAFVSNRPLSSFDSLGLSTYREVAVRGSYVVTKRLTAKDALNHGLVVKEFANNLTDLAGAEGIWDAVSAGKSIYDQKSDLQKLFELLENKGRWSSWKTVASSVAIESARIDTNCKNVFSITQYTTEVDDRITLRNLDGYAMSVTLNVKQWFVWATPEEEKSLGGQFKKIGDYDAYKKWLSNPVVIGESVLLTSQGVSRVKETAPAVWWSLIQKHMEPGTGIRLNADMSNTYPNLAELNAKWFEVTN
jgi:RHS repeat-associated protein